MRKRLRILILSDVYYPTPGGVSEHIFNFTKKMRKKGHTVKIVAPSGKNKEIKPEYSEGVIRVGRAMMIKVNKSIGRTTIGWNVYNKVKDIIRNNKWDIIHSHGPFAPVLPYLAHKFYSKENITGEHITAKIATFHASFRRVWSYNLIRNYLYNRFKRIDGLIAVSEEAKKSVLQYFDGEFIIIPNGVDADKFNPNLPRIEEFKKENFNIFFAGRFDKRKGVNYLVQAFYFILKAVPNAFLWIGGGDKYRKLGLEIIIRRITKKYPEYGKRICYLKFIPHKLLPNYFKSADLFCSPAIAGESFGIVLIESMAAGTPIVASNIPGYKDVVEHGEDGLLAKPKSVKDLAKQIIRLANDENLRKKFSINGRNKVEERFVWDKVTNQIEDFYYETLKKKYEKIGKNFNKFN